MFPRVVTHCSHEPSVFNRTCLTWSILFRERIPVSTLLHFPHPPHLRTTTVDPSTTALFFLPLDLASKMARTSLSPKNEAEYSRRKLGKRAPSARLAAMHVASIFHAFAPRRQPLVRNPALVTCSITWHSRVRGKKVRESYRARGRGHWRGKSKR